MSIIHELLRIILRHGLPDGLTDGVQQLLENNLLETEYFSA